MIIHTVFYIAKKKTMFKNQFITLCRTVRERDRLTMLISRKYEQLVKQECCSVDTNFAPLV